MLACARSSSRQQSHETQLSRCTEHNTAAISCISYKILSWLQVATIRTPTSVLTCVEEQQVAYSNLRQIEPAVITTCMTEPPYSSVPITLTLDLVKQNIIRAFLFVSLIPECS
jgi:hypothetical protein